MVNSAVSAGPMVQGTLTWAIYQANYNGADLNYIHFDIPGTPGEIEILLTETLYIARPMVINGASQPGYAGVPLIRINCNGLNAAFNVVGAVNGIPPLSTGEVSTGAGSRIQGFRIVNYRSNGITLSRGADGNTVANNYIGFAPLTPGTFFKNADLYPECRGIGIQSSSNVIRGNTISGVDNAITLGDDIAAPTGTIYRGNSFQRNFIGTDPTGATKIGNASDGIFLGAGAQDNFIGPGNVISGMASAGVELLHATATGNTIFANIIGLNAAGTEAISNGGLGVLIANGAASNWVGGPYGGAYSGNIISGNRYGGVAIGTDEFAGPNGSNNNRVEGNFIGTDGTKSAGLGAQISGVTVQSNSKWNTVRKNVIVGQVNHGVVFSNAANNAMYGNWIGRTSGGKTIANGGFGVYLWNASRNIVQLAVADAGVGTERNLFGSNQLDVVGINGTCVDNVIDLSASPPPTPTPTPTPVPTPSQLVNISTRLRVENGENALIAGFIITGDSAKKVIVRGLGTSLTMAGALADPSLELITNNGSVNNDDWRSDQEAAIVASGIPPASNLESAIIATLEPGAYTAIMRGKGNTTGVGLLEVYDLDSSTPAILANISTRGIVQSGDKVMIAGFIVGAGPTDSRVVVRALGPSLAASGISSPLGNPTLQLTDGNGTIVRQSDDWQQDTIQATELIAIGIAPPNQLESAIVATLAPGAYTAVVAGKGGTTGTALVEVFNIR